VELWRLAARNLFLATSELQRSAQQPWLTRAEVAWPLIADAAEVIEAVSLLDARLSTTPSHPVPKRDLLTHLLVASDVSRIARIMRSDSSADVATSGWGAFTSDDGPPITLVRTASDWATAQRRLAGFVRPHPDPEGRVAVRDQPGLKVARVLATGQTMLNHAFARWAQQAGERALADSFRSRVDLYQRLHASMTRIVDLVPHRSPLPTLQQSEMVTQLRTRPEERLSLAQLGDLNEATYELTRELGKALRREAMARGRLQTLGATTDWLPIPRAITTTRHPFYVACKALADAPPPPSDATVQIDKSARLWLAASLRTASFRTPARTF
jgi:hypothetical protein